MLSLTESIGVTAESFELFSGFKDFLRAPIE